KDLRPGAGGEIQLTDALKVLLNYEAIYAYNFEGKRYDVGDKLGYLKATVEYALKRDDLKDDFIKYLKTLNLASCDALEDVAISGLDVK
ncbi:MAG: UTP--glucose-phosphate uridylyltransferase, partial [Thermoanaerobacterium sp.]|nr:UTP--glucose-phosphate uridylyltransferase [Thermoanaerobacterium sp.]